MRACEEDRTKFIEQAPQAGFRSGSQPMNQEEQVGDQRGGYLSLDRFLASSRKGLDFQMLLDPFEEAFNLPASLIALRNHRGGLARSWVISARGVS